MDHKLTAQMLDALRHVMFGVQKYPSSGLGPEGYYSIDNPGLRLDTRSLVALLRRGLIGWHSRGGNPQVIVLDPTEEGEQIYYWLEATGQWD